MWFRWIAVGGMFLLGGRNRCLGSVRGRVSVLLATGENKRGDGSPVKSSAQENGLKLGAEVLPAWPDYGSKRHLVERFEIACRERARVKLRGPFPGGLFIERCNAECAVCKRQIYFNSSNIKNRKDFIQ